MAFLRFNYLLKPIPFDRFLKAVNKANELFNLKRNAKSTPVLEGKHTLDDKFIMVKADYSLIKIDLNSILYIEGLKDYLKIYIKGQKPILTLSSFKKIEEKLPGDFFVRVHRSFIVSILKIESVQKHRIKINNELIPVGDSYKDNFYTLLDSDSLI